MNVLQSSKGILFAVALSLVFASSVAWAKPSKPVSGPELKQFIKGATQKLLSKKDQSSADEIAKTIIDASAKFKFDPIFLMAVIQNESSFNPKQKGGVGELGLMQIKPSSAKWISEQYHLRYEDEKTLLDPKMNIQIGVALLDRFRKRFNTKGQLFLAAYNMGEGNVRKFVKMKKYPREYVRAVMTRYLALSRAYGSLVNPKKKGALAFSNIQNIHRLPNQKLKM